MTAPSLTDAQIRDIRKLRALGHTRKQIARRIGCTINQARHYSDGVAKDSALRSGLLRTNMLRGELAREVAEARAETATAEPFKRGDLRW